MFEIKDKFYLDGKPFQIISGAFHYFRTVPEYWRDRMEKLVNMGCNTVETYIPWNFHEPEEGKFIWEGMRDICRFLDIAKELELYVIIRPSPYICAEWEFGGLPPWLLKDGNMRLRCSCPPYLEAVDRYYSQLMPKLEKYQYHKSGTIIMMQVENEYGYYGNDSAYLEFLKNTIRKYGVTVPLVTSDGPWRETVFRSGWLRGALPTGNFGSGGEWQFSQMEKYMGKDKPLMCMEFWDGWFDAWGEEHHTTEPEKAAEELDVLLRLGNLNFYMFEGGTNFGFMNGRNGGSLNGDVTSYDYDAPLTEDGQITEKYRLFREVIRKYKPIREIPLTTVISRIDYGKIKCCGKTDLFSVLEDISTPVMSPYPLSMEEIGQNYGYILYRTKLPDWEQAEDIALEGAGDRVQCFHNGSHVFTAVGGELNSKFTFSEKAKGAVIYVYSNILDVLCENIGRENFGTALERQRKGITGSIKVNDCRHFGLEIYPLPMDEQQISKVDFEKTYREGLPAFYKFTFSVSVKGDTFLDTRGFGKGCAFINGFNLGRFWEIGPQKKLYIPAPLLREGENTLIIFETEGTSASEVTLSDTPGLGGK